MSHVVPDAFDQLILTNDLGSVAQAVRRVLYFMIQ